MIFSLKCISSMCNIVCNDEYHGGNFGLHGFSITIAILVVVYN